MKNRHEEREPVTHDSHGPTPMGRRGFLQSLGALPLSAAVGKDVLGVTPPGPTTDFKKIDEAIREPWGKLFWIERKAGKYRMGDPASHFNANRDFKHLTFDIGNNKALANVGVQGTIKKVTIYRDSYWGNCNLPGVWTAKDTSCFGPYSYIVDIGGQAYDLATVDWDFRTGLLDNIFPVTELHDPMGRFIVRLLTYAPLSADGAQRLRGVIYGLHLENISDKAVKGAVRLPKLFADNRDHQYEFDKIVWHEFDPYEFELGLGDSSDPSQREVSFNLGKGESVWVPTILYMPNDPVAREVNERGTLTWLSESWRYYRRLLGRLKTPGDDYLAEFFERQMIQSLLSIAMSSSGKLAGANWGSYPTTRQIWSKDAYYACLPITLKDPLLAQKIILWFAEFGVRQKSVFLPGGVNHSLSISLASVVLGGRYYEQTGDKTFFTRHPALNKKWDALLQAVLASRRKEDVWLFPSRYVSDGELECDYHTGTNVVVWRALRDYGRLLEEVYGEPERAREYAQVADKVRATIMEKTVIDGPFGPQFIEGIYRDGRKPLMLSDGEESDTTLMPFYGFLSYDDSTYLHYMHFSMTTYNQLYQPKAHAITWASSPTQPPLDQRIPSTAPGYMKGLCDGTDRSSLFGEHGYFSEVRKITDADGSVWWWSYGSTPEWKYGNPVRGIPGKSGWFAGVHSAVFLSRFLGLSYDAPKRTLRFAPFSPSSDFSWTDFPMGSDRFSLNYEKTAAAVRTTLKNQSSHSVRVEALLPVDGLERPFKVSLNGKLAMNTQSVSYLGRQTVRILADVTAGGLVHLEVACAAHSERMENRDDIAGS
jgi:hypothetical protein